MLLGSISDGIAAGKSITLADIPSKYKSLYVTLQIAQDVVCTKIPLAVFVKYTNLTIRELDNFLNVIVQIEWNSMIIYNCNVSGTVATASKWQEIAQVSLYGCDML